MSRNLVNDAIPSERPPPKDASLFQDVVWEVFLRARTELVHEHDVVLSELRAANAKLKVENEQLRVHHSEGQIRVSDPSAPSLPVTVFNTSSAGETTHAAVQFDVACVESMTTEPGKMMFQVLKVWSELNTLTQGTVDFEEATKQMESKAANYEAQLKSLVDKGVLSGGEPQMSSLAGSFLVQSPQSSRRLTWDMLASVVLVYEMFMLPLLLLHPPKDGVFFGMATVAMFYWTLDIPATFLVGYFNADGEIEMRLGKVVKRYLKAWFWLDIVVVITDWLTTGTQLLGGAEQPGAVSTVGLARISKLARVFRLARLVRLLRLRKLTSLMRAVQDHVEVEYFGILMEIGRNVVSIVAINHYLACLWYWVGDAFSEEESWLHTFGHPDWFSNYLVCAYWSIAQFTPGSSGIQPTNNAETLFATLVLFFALVVFSVFVSSTTTLISRLVNIQSSRSKQLWILKGYLKQHQIPRDLKVRVLRYVNIALGTRQDMIHRADVELLGLLSEPLHEELQRNLHQRSLSLHPFFKFLGLSSSILSRKMCVAALREGGYSRHDTLFSIGQSTDRMFFLVAGVLSYTATQLPTGSIFLAAGDHFCEAVLWTEWLCCGVMQADIDCECLEMNSIAFQDVVKRHHVEVVFVKRYAAAFVAALNFRLEDQEHPLHDMQADLLNDPGVARVLTVNAREADTQSTASSTSSAFGFSFHPGRRSHRNSLGT